MLNLSSERLLPIMTNEPYPSKANNIIMGAICDKVQVQPKGLETLDSHTYLNNRFSVLASNVKSWLSCVFIM
jgi:hypothetical protein